MTEGSKAEPKITVKGIFYRKIPSLPVTSLGNYVFDGCTSLTEINIPNSVTTMGKSAFSSCTYLTSVTIPDSVTSIGKNAFYNSKNVTIDCQDGSYAQDNNIRHKIIKG